MSKDQRLQFAERLRQEREIFEQRKSHEARWFRLRLVMGYASVACLFLIMAIASWILMHNADFPPALVHWAGAALFADVLGLLISIWKITMNPGNLSRAEPTTDCSLTFHP